VIHLFHGKDDYQIRSALHALRDDLKRADDMLDSNTTLLDGRTVTPLELMAHATAVPFLAANRLVIVEGLLGGLGGVKGGRRKKKGDGDDPLDGWRDAAEQLSDPKTMPDTTTLVLIEGDIPKTNAAFTIFAPIARTREFGAMAGAELSKWLREAEKSERVTLSEGAERALLAALAPDLWALKNAVAMLAAFAGGEPVDETMVRDLVTATDDTKFWDLTDAVVAGNERKALSSLQRLLTDGSAPAMLSAMLVRQYRQLAIVKDLRDRRAGQDEIARASGVPAFKVGAVSALASRYSWRQVRAAYDRLLAADLSVKRGLQDDGSALQLLVHELCAAAPKGAGPRAAYAR
jgi:DNA polymerase III delta subunit